MKKLTKRLLIDSTKWIGKIAHKYPSLARAVESALYGALLAGLTALVEDPASALYVFGTVFGAGIISALKKWARAQQEALKGEDFTSTQTN